MSLNMLRLHPTQDYETPYEYDTDGFTERWWHSPFITETIEEQKGNDYWSFQEEEKENVRAWLEKITLDDCYTHFIPSSTATKISFFEVRQSYRRLGYGTAAIGMSISHYSNQLIATFPVDEATDAFWHSVGFIYQPRKDGTDRRDSVPQRYSPLFIYDNRQDVTADYPAT